mmetsp:Transcript_26685/g.85657  ORF Transcript_26685/g.85657 Transcript_26685/m.85657 type:complete len:244 (+) Transcript_26685:1122-1853(+)
MLLPRRFMYIISVNMLYSVGRPPWSRFAFVIVSCLSFAIVDHSGRSLLVKRLLPMTKYMSDLREDHEAGRSPVTPLLSILRISSACSTLQAACSGPEILTWFSSRRLSFVSVENSEGAVPVRRLPLMLRYVSALIPLKAGESGPSALKFAMSIRLIRPTKSQVIPRKQHADAVVSGSVPHSATRFSSVRAALNSSRAARSIAGVTQGSAGVHSSGPLPSESPRERVRLAMLTSSPAEGRQPQL